MSLSVNANAATAYTPALSPKPATDSTVTVTPQTGDGAATIPGDGNQAVASPKTPFTASGMKLDMGKLSGGSPDPAKLQARLEALAASGEKIQFDYDKAVGVTKDENGNFAITTYDTVNGFGGMVYEEADSITVSPQTLSSLKVPPSMDEAIAALAKDPKPAPTGDVELPDAFVFAPQ
jgi:hypothetical protein